MRAEELRALPPREDRWAGAILGLAVGNALGARTSSAARAVLEDPEVLIGQPSHGHVGKRSPTCSLTLCLAPGPVEHFGESLPRCPN